MPVVAEHAERVRAQRLREAAPAPRAAHGHVLQPARLIPSASFSSVKIAFITRPGDLVAVPRDRPQGRCSSPGRGTRHEVALGLLAVAPVVAERLVVRVEDRPVWSSGRTGRSSRPSGSGCSGSDPVRKRRISNPYRIGT